MKGGLSEGQWQPSTFRLALGGCLFALAVVTALLALTALDRSLQQRGYGSREVSHALIWLGAAGAALGAGVSLVIWEMSIRLRHPLDTERSREAARNRRP